MKIQATPVFQNNWDALNSGKYKYIINSGSSRSSKTFSILQIFWLLAWTKPRTKLSVFRNTKKDCKDTILQDMLKYYPNLEDWDKIVYNKTESVLTFPNGSTINIEGTDDDLKVHGYHSDYLWFNEFYRMSKDTFDQLDMRCTTAVFMDYNPIGRLWSDDLTQQDNAILIHSTFKDNPFIPLEQKKKILGYEPTEYNKQQKTADSYKWSVYGLGLKAEKPNRIYKNWIKISDKEFNQILASSYYGLDFGSANPSALVEVKYKDGNFFSKQRMYLPITQMKSSLAEVLKGLGLKQTDLIIADSADPNRIAELINAGLNVLPAIKGQGSVNQGLDFVNSMTNHYTESSTELEYEVENYEWEIVNGMNLNRPIKKDDHCFIGETLVKTINGNKQIKDIEVDDYVLTSNGYNRVLIKWDNGIKKTSKYLMHFDTFSLSLVATDNHLIKTTKGWKKISELQKSDRVYLFNTTTENHLDCKKEKDTLTTVQKKCTYSFGKAKTKQKFQKDTTCIILMKIHKIIELITLKLLRLKNTFQTIVKKDLPKILSLQKNFKEKELQKHLNGIEAKKVLSGIEKTQKTTTSEAKHMEIEIVSNAKKNLLQKTLTKNTVTQIARLKAIEVKESSENRVYDLTVEETHEYFANGILVHNCIDADRYIKTFLQFHLDIK